MNDWGSKCGVFLFSFLDNNVSSDVEVLVRISCKLIEERGEAMAKCMYVSMIDRQGQHLQDYKKRNAAIISYS
jgi:hypothetical protein